MPETAGGLPCNGMDRLTGAGAADGLQEAERIQEAGGYKSVSACAQHCPTPCTSRSSSSQNLNYRSPSEHHPALGIAIHKVVRRNDPASPWDPAALRFTHSVASGDPYADSVILWTRVAPSADNDASNATVSGLVALYSHEVDGFVAASAAPVCVDYVVAPDAGLQHVVAQGRVYTSSDVDYTVKVRARAAGAADPAARGEGTRAVHDISLPVPCVRVRQYQPRRAHQDGAAPRRRRGRAAPRRVLVLQLP